MYLYYTRDTFVIAEKEETAFSHLFDKCYEELQSEDFDVHIDLMHKYGFVITYALRKSENTKMKEQMSLYYGKFDDGCHYTCKRCRKRFEKTKDQFGSYFHLAQKHFEENPEDKIDFAMENLYIKSIQVSEIPVLDSSKSGLH